MPAQPAANSEPAAPSAPAPAAARRLAPATLRLYCADWLVFAQWCAAHAQPALPATPVRIPMKAAGDSD